MNMTDAEFYRSARTAVTHYIRDIACLPRFPSSIPETRNYWYSQTHRVMGPVLRVVATNEVSGQILPRTEDAWIAMRPFDDLTKSMSADAMATMLQRRMTVITLLVRLSASPRFGWSPRMDCGSVQPEESGLHPRETFWLDVVRDKDSDTTQDRTMSLERNLAAMSRSHSPRFLLCVDSDMSQWDIEELLEEFLGTDKTSVIEGSDKKNAFDKVLETCGLLENPIPSLKIDLGLHFTTGKMTDSMVSQIFNVMKRLESTECRGEGITFHLTALYIGTGCSIKPKALEVIHEQWNPDGDLTSLFLGSIDDVQPSQVQQCLIRLTKEPKTKLHRLGVTAEDKFPAFASVFRTTSDTSIHEIDVKYTPTEANAAWLAFAFFHVDSESRISSICLRTDTPFTVPWMQAFERSLQSQRPCKDLVGEEGDNQESSQRMLVTVSTSTAVKIQPCDGAELLTTISGETNGSNQELERLLQIDKYVGVVIPGVGVGWVPQESIISTRLMPNKPTSDETYQHNGRVKALAIDPTRGVYPEHMNTMLRLLEVIGKPLEHLQLPHCRFDQNHLVRILQCCPNLRELNISGHIIASIDPLVNAYMTGQCKIHTLSLSYRAGWNPDTIPEQLTSFLREIPTTKRLPLRQLALHLVTDRECNAFVSKCTATVAENLAKALTKLPMLYLLHLTTAEVCSIVNQPLPLAFSSRIGYDPLPLQCKLAFLSAVQHPTLQEHRVLHQLDTLVLSRIFSFSGLAVARHAFRYHQSQRQRT